MLSQSELGRLYEMIRSGASQSDPLVLSAAEQMLEAMRRANASIPGYRGSGKAEVNRREMPLARGANEMVFREAPQAQPKDLRGMSFQALLAARARALGISLRG